MANLSVIMEEMKLVDSKHGQLIKNLPSCKVSGNSELTLLSMIVGQLTLKLDNLKQ